MTPEEESELVRSHKAFVYKHALKEFRATGRDLDDCVQDAYIAFLASARAWREDGGANIRTFAWTHQWRARNNRKIKRGRELHPAFSIDEPLRNEGEARDLTYHEVLAAEPTGDPEAEELEGLVREAVHGLPPKWRRIIRLRFFEGMTLKEIGEDYGVCGERIRQIECEILKVLRARLEKVVEVQP